MLLLFLASIVIIDLNFYYKSINYIVKNFDDDIESIYISYDDGSSNEERY